MVLSYSANNASNHRMNKLFAKFKRASQFWRLKLANVVSRRSVVSPDGAVVSLTTHGIRLEQVYLTIESIARGAVRPSRLILWRNPGSDDSYLPKSLARLQRRGLEIQFSENFGPHTKYFPYVASVAMHEIPLVTADDDVIYPSHWLRDLVVAHTAEPQHVHCYRARRVQISGIALKSYEEWPFADSKEPSSLNFATGVSGVVYPPALLDALRKAGPAFMACCPKADDVWLHAMALRHGYKIKQLSASYSDFPVAPMTQGLALYINNARPEGNDKQISATYDASDIEALVQENASI